MIVLLSCVGLMGVHGQSYEWSKNGLAEWHLRTADVFALLGKGAFVVQCGVVRDEGWGPVGSLVLALRANDDVEVLVCRKRAFSPIIRLPGSPVGSKQSEGLRELLHRLLNNRAQSDQAAAIKGGFYIESCGDKGTSLSRIDFSNLDPKDDARILYEWWRVYCAEVVDESILDKLGIVRLPYSEKSNK